MSDDRKAAKPKRASLFAGMSESSVTLDQALQLLTLPRELGPHPADGAMVIASPGRFGPYIKHGNEFRSLDSEDQLFTVTIDEAVALLAEPKKSRRRPSAAKALLKEVGKHPSSGAAITLLAGRYGPYVTDGTTNASLPKGQAPEQLTLEQAVELLAAREGAPKKSGRAVKRGGGAGTRKSARRKTVGAPT
jgi:DNA topoisomerase-1